jgi:hypothetical protein
VCSPGWMISWQEHTGRRSALGYNQRRHRRLGSRHSCESGDGVMPGAKQLGQFKWRGLISVGGGTWPHTHTDNPHCCILGCTRRLSASPACMPWYYPSAHARSSASDSQAAGCRRGGRRSRSNRCQRCDARGTARVYGRWVVWETAVLGAAAAVVIALLTCKCRSHLHGHSRRHRCPLSPQPPVEQGERVGRAKPLSTKQQLHAARTWMLQVSVHKPGGELGG